MKPIFYWLWSLCVCMAALNGEGLLTKGDVSPIIKQIAEQHYGQREVSTETLKGAFKAYINQFDPQRIYLLKEETQPYDILSDAALKSLLQQFKANDYSAFEKLNTTIQKAITRARILREELEKNPEQLARLPAPKLQDEEFADPDLQLPFATNTSELKKRNATQLAEFINAEKTRFGTELVAKHLFQTINIYEKSAREREDHYLYINDKGDKLSAAEQENYLTMHILKALAKSLDPHTSFYTEAEANDVKVRLQKEFEGVGITMKQKPDGTVFISELIPDAPASKSGQVKVNDQLLAINGQKVAGQPVHKLMELMRGEGREVQLTLLHKDSKNPVEVKLKKEEITLQKDRVDTTFEKYGDGIIGIITLHSFYQGDHGVTSELDVKKAITDLKSKGNLRGLILDFRENSGGFLNQAVKVAGLFITNGVVVISKYFNGEEHFYRDLDSSTMYDGPIVILTSRATASAAEIVAQSLQDYGVALIVGDESTYGKGTIQNQTVTANTGTSFFKVTVGKYYTVSGKTPQLEGVKADVVVPGPFSKAHMGERYLDATLAADTIPPDFNDDLADVSPEMKDWYLRYYMPTLQHKRDLWRGMIDTLKSNSALRQTQKGSPNDNSAQLAEAVNVVKDMIKLEVEARNSNSRRL